MSVYSYGVAIVLSLIYIWYKGVDISDIWLIAILSSINVLFYFFSILCRIESMKNIDSVIFFPIFKTIGPIAITALSYFYFGEQLTIKEIIGIIIWITVPLLLISAHENKRQIHMKRGLIFLVITVLLTIVSTATIKELQIQEWDIALFLLFTSIFGVIISYMKYKYTQKKENFKIYNDNKLVSFSLLVGVFHFFWLFTFTQALAWNLAVVFTINSFGILIPIILSIIFYKDHFNFKKAFVILLSIISIILFI